MKNDVVRWSSTTATKEHNKHRHNHHQQHNSNNTLSSSSNSNIIHKVCSQLQQHHHQQQQTQTQQGKQKQPHQLKHVATETTAAATTISATSQQQHDPETLAFNDSNENLSSSVKCDTNVYDLYLVQQNIVVNSRRRRFNLISSNKKCGNQQHKYLYQQQHLLNEASYSGRCNSSSGSSRSSNSNTSDSSSYHGGRRTSLMFLLQISTVVLICSFNIGFVTSANILEDEHQLASHHNSYTYIPPYELDYEESGNDIGGHYTHTWAVHIPDGDREGKAETVAKAHGFVNLGKIFNDHYHFAHHKVTKRSLTPALTHQSRLDDDERVHWAQQQIAKSRRKRDFIRMRPSRTSSRSALVNDFRFNDPKWSHMWYLNRGGDLDMNVIPAWEDGITGKGIVVTILDDGLESDHPDIISNYDPKASYDVNSHDEDPMPHYDLTDSNRHGTRCAGEVAATANNSICAVGIAFGASVGGVRMLDGDVTDAVEARSLSLNPQHIDIYSASWGPDDDGKTVDGPGELASRAFIEGVTKGRAGKGSIFIWASGNGGRELDNCNCDGYTNSIWTLSISSATEEGHVPWYSEKCSSTLATTYSSGSQAEKQVVTTDLHHSCTVSHTGTSASAPLAAGIAALVLESNSNLTWRDLQHIVVRTAKPANLVDPSWSKNGVGRRVSHSFGYGLMDASAMVKVARNWKTVPEQQRCEINAPHVDKVIPSKGHITLQLSVKNCLNINYLEHVQAKITLTSQRRGDIQLNLISPAGTKVTLLTPRVHDTSHSGFNQWPFMSVHTWGESPHGNWQLEIHNEGRYMGHALLREWSLIFYGTTQPIDLNDPISIPRTTLVDITTPNSSSGTTNLHQIYSAQYPRISLNNFSFSKLGKLPSSTLAKLPPNKSVYVAAANSDMTNDPLFKVMNPAGSSNKKQQQLSKLSSSSSSASGGYVQNPKNSKVNKNNKGKSQENNKSNKNSNNNGKSSKQKESTTPSTPGSQKNKFYRISQQSKLSNMKSQGSSSDNPKQSKMSKLQQSTERLQSYEDKMNRKVIGDLPLTSLSSTGSSNGKSILKAILTAGKLPVKATKQVKEPFSTRQPFYSRTTEVSLTNRGASSAATAGMQPNQRITKLFERYEKIQSIFPEFQPYQPILKDVDSNNAAVTVKNKTPKQSQLEAQTNTSTSSSGSTFTKPSRENSKKSSPSFIPDQKIMKKQQLLLAAAGVSSGTQMPMSVAISSSHRQSSNAQITQWDLIFYGTEAPAQPDDPVPINSKQFSPFGNDMEHNDIEYDPSDQWNNLQQMGNPSMMTHDRTNTSCVKTTVNHQCLECAPPTLFFMGRCYDMCPVHTFVHKHNGNLDGKDNSMNNNNRVTNRPNNHFAAADEDELQSLDRRRRRSKSRSGKMVYTTTNDYESNQYNKNTNMEEDDEEERENSMGAAMNAMSCEPCDKSCYRCYGRLNSQCSTCFTGSQLRKMPHTNETYCINFSERSSGNAIINQSVKGLNPTIIVLFLVPSVLIISLVIFLTTYGKELCRLPWRREQGTAEIKAAYTYDRVALIGDEDDPEEEIDLFTAGETQVKIYTDNDDDDNADN